jgi:hypothetical protein
MPEPVERLGEARVWHPPRLGVIAALPSGRVVTAGPQWSELLLWNVASGTCLGRIELPGATRWGGVRSIVASPVAEQVACVLWNGRAYLAWWEPEPRVQRLSRRRGAGEQTIQVEFSPDGAEVLQVTSWECGGPCAYRWSCAQTGRARRIAEGSGEFSWARIAPDLGMVARGAFRLPPVVDRFSDGAVLTLDPPESLWEEAANPVWLSEVIPLVGEREVLVRWSGGPTERREVRDGALRPIEGDELGTLSVFATRSGRPEVLVGRRGRAGILVPETGEFREVGPQMARMVLGHEAKVAFGAYPRGGVVALPGEGEPLAETPHWLTFWALAFGERGELVAAANPARSFLPSAIVDAEGLDHPALGVPEEVQRWIRWQVGSLDVESEALRLEFLRGGEALRMWFPNVEPRAWVPGGEEVDSGVHESLRFPEIPEVSPDGRYLASLRATAQELRARIAEREIRERESSPYGRRFRVFAAETGELLAEAEPFEGRRLSVLGFSLDSQLLACGSRAGELALLELPTCDRRVELGGAGGLVRALAFSPDRRLLVAACRRGQRVKWGTRLHVFDLRRYQRVATVGATERYREVVELRFSPTGNVLAAVERPQATHLDWVVTLQRLEQRGRDGVVWSSQRVPLPGHRGRVLALAFSADGRRLATSGEEGTVQVWDVEVALAGAREPHGP